MGLGDMIRRGDFHRRRNLGDPKTHPVLRPGSCVLWLNGEDLDRSIADGAKVSSWPDRSGFSNHATQGTDASRPLMCTPCRNYWPGVYFAGEGTHLLLTSAVTLSSFTCITVSSLVSITQASHYLIGGAGTGLHRSGNYAGVNGFGAFDGSAQLMATVEPLDWELMSYTNDKLFRNGVEISGYDAGGVGPVGSVTFGVVGRRETSWAGGYHNGRITEIALFAGVLSNTDRRRIEEYMADKYVFTLS